MRKLTAFLIALALVAAACSSDSSDDEASTTTQSDTTTSAPADTEPPETDPPPTEPAETDPPPTGDTVPTTTAGGDDGGGGAGPVAVTLAEWTVDAPTTLTAGTVEFAITNEGSFSHELAVARGESYDTLPQLPNRAVDEDTLGADFLGRSDLIDTGIDGVATFDLEPGNYVLFCNVQVGPNSHAAQGQTLSVTVS